MKTVCIDDFLNSDLTEPLVMSSEQELEKGRTPSENHGSFARALPRCFGVQIY